MIVLPLPELEERPSKIKPLNLRKYAGCIKKFGDGLEYQRKIRLEGTKVGTVKKLKKSVLFTAPV